MSNAAHSIAKFIAVQAIIGILAIAQTQAAQWIETIDPAELCAGPGDTGAASLYRLSRALVSTGKIPIEMLDWNDTGVGYDQYARAVTVRMCLNPGDPMYNDKCTDANRTAQSVLVNNVAHAFEIAAQKTSRDDFDLTLAKQTIHFHRVKQVSDVDKKKFPVYHESTVSIATEVFSRDPVLFEATCRPITGQSPVVIAIPPSSGTPTTQAAASPSQPGGTAATTAMPAAAGESSAISIFAPLRLRANTYDLDVDRSSSDFAGLDPASLAISDDRIANQYTFDVHLVLGYALPSYHYGNDLYLDSIPFITYDRDYIEGSQVPANSNIHNLGFGIRESLTFNTLGFYSNISFQPQYTYSLKYGAEIVKLHSSWQPEPLLPFVGYAAKVGNSNFLLSAYAQVPFNVGRVLRAAGEPTLAQTNSFVQGGFAIGAALTDTTDSSWLNGLSLPVSYTYLHGFSGQFRDIRLLQTSLNYTFPQTKYISIGISYTDGRDLDTFEMQKIYKVSLGLKY